MPSPYCYEYPRPAVTVDMVVFALDGDDLRVALIRRKAEPFAGMWALPGGFLEMDEEVHAGCLRELREETGLDAVDLMAPLGVFGAPGRDPRGRTISLAHAAVVGGPPPPIEGADDAAEAGWFAPGEVTEFAFDHEEIFLTALKWLVLGVHVGPIGLALLPEVFTDADAKRLIRAVGGQPAEATAWRKRHEEAGDIVALPGRPKKYQTVFFDEEDDEDEDDGLTP